MAGQKPHRIEHIAAVGIERRRLRQQDVPFAALPQRLLQQRRRIFVVYQRAAGADDVFYAAEVLASLEQLAAD